MEYKPYQEIHAYRGKMKEQELQMHTGKKNTSKHSSTLAAHSSSNTVYSKNTNIYHTWELKQWEDTRQAGRLLF